MVAISCDRSPYRSTKPGCPTPTLCGSLMTEVSSNLGVSGSPVRRVKDLQPDSR
jgi:hypothetical protein